MKKFRASLDVGIYGKKFLGTFLFDIIHHVWSFYDELLVQLIVAGMTLDFPGLSMDFRKKQEIHENYTKQVGPSLWVMGSEFAYVALCLFQ